MGGRIYHMTWDFQARWDFQDWKWQELRWEDEFTTADGTSEQEMGLPRWEVAGNDMDEMGGRIYQRRWDVQNWTWQVMRWEDEFTTGDGTSKMGSGR